MKKNYLITFIIEAVVLVSQILVFKLAANLLGKQGFGEYALAKRTIAFMVPVLLLGLSVGIPRYVAMAQVNRSNKETPELYFIGAFCIICIVTFLLLLIINLFPSQIAYLFFGNHHYQYLILPLSSSVAGICLHSLAYSYYRGYLKMVQANLLQLLNIGIIPILVFAMPDISVSAIFSIMGLSWIVTSGIAVFTIFKRSQREDWKLSKISHKSKELLNYGVMRVPGGFGMAALLTLPATLTAHFSGMEKAGYVAFAVSILSFTGSLFYPLGLIMLPSASQQVAKKDLAGLQISLKKLLKISLGITALMVLFFELFAQDIIKIYLGKEFLEATNIMRVVLIGAIPYVVYAIFGNALDAIYVKPMNMKNIMIALGLFSFITVIGGSFSYLITALCAGLFILGAFTWYDVSRAFRKVSNLERMT